MNRMEVPYVTTGLVLVLITIMDLHRQMYGLLKIIIQTTLFGIRRLVHRFMLLSA